MKILSTDCDYHVLLCRNVYHVFWGWPVEQVTHFRRPRKRDLNSYFAILSGRGAASQVKQTQEPQYKWAKCAQPSFIRSSWRHFTIMLLLSTKKNPQSLLFQLEQMQFSRRHRAKTSCSKQDSWGGEAVWIYWRMCLQQGGPASPVAHIKLQRKRWATTAF